MLTIRVGMEQFHFNMSMNRLVDLLPILLEPGYLKHGFPTRNSKMFRYIYNYLIDGTITFEGLSASDKKQLLREFSFYGVRVLDPIAQSRCRTAKCILKAYGGDIVYDAPGKTVIMDIGGGKILKLILCKHEMVHFDDEVQITRELSGVVGPKFYESRRFETKGSKLFGAIVMEKLDSNLTDVIGKVSIPRLMEQLIGLFVTLANNGYQCLDIKTDNLCVNLDDDLNIVDIKMIDFGGDWCQLTKPDHNDFHAVTMLLLFVLNTCENRHKRYLSDKQCQEMWQSFKTITKDIHVEDIGNICKYIRTNDNIQTITHHYVGKKRMEELYSTISTYCTVKNVL